MATPASGIETWLTLNNQPISFRPGTENMEANALEYRENLFRATSQAPVQLELYIDGRRQSSEHLGFWKWEPIDFAGLYDIQIQGPGIQPQKTRIRVLPRKLSLERYEAMQQELSDISADLLLQLISPAKEKALAGGHKQETSPLHDYEQIKSLVSELSEILAHIAQQPYYTLQESNEIFPLHTIQTFSSNITPFTRSPVRLPEHAAAVCKQLYLPDLWQTRQCVPTFDVYENRLLKHFLQKQLMHKLSIVQSRAEQEIERRETYYAAKVRKKKTPNQIAEMNRLKEIVRDCQRIKQHCWQWSNQPFLQHVLTTVGPTKATQVLLKHPSYSRFYYLYLQFQRRLRVSINSERYAAEVALRRVSELYEMWSVFLATSWIIDILLAHDYLFVSQTLFYELEKDYFQFDIKRNEPAIVLMRDKTRLVIKYEPIYTHYQQIEQADLVSDKNGASHLTPDMAIEVYQQGKPQSILVFDAKYKREQGHDKRYHPMSKDLDTMNMYYNSILYKSYSGQRVPPQLQPIVSSAYVFFPGNRISQNARQTIGGLPMMPHMDSQLVQEARQTLVDLLKMANIL